MNSPSFAKIDEVTNNETEVEGTGQIRSFKLPAGWVGKDKPQSGGIGFRYMRYHADPANPLVKVCLFYRGMPMSEAGTDAFRSYLQESAFVIYKADDVITDSVKAALTKLSETLDNAGNNQILNQEKGFRGPNFILQNAEITEVGAKSVLSVRGYYIDPDSDKRLTEYWGLFFDGKPEEKQCPVQEIYFEAPDEQQFAQHSNIFKRVLDSLQWRFKQADQKPAPH